MKSRADAPYGYNAQPVLGPFFGDTSGSSVPFTTRVKEFVGWVCGAALTAPSAAPDHMSEHFNSGVPVAPLQQSVQVEQVQA